MKGWWKEQLLWDVGTVPWTTLWIPHTRPTDAVVPQADLFEGVTETSQLKLHA